jgi:hypothetical protein
MRIKNSYLRNRHFRLKTWKRIRRLTNPYEYTHGAWYYTSEEQIKNHFDTLTKNARGIDSGSHKHWNHASAAFRRQLNKQRKASERVAMQKIRNGRYDVEVPFFKNDADWLRF